MSDTKIIKAEDMGLSEKQSKLVLEKTPAKHIKKREGRGGQILDYVETGYVVSRLNETFKYMWSFEVKESKIENGQITVLGVLTAHIVLPTNPPIVQAIVKSQYGGSDIKKTKDGRMLDYADDYKAATSDALKKCASLFGIAQDVYWKSESEERKHGGRKTAEEAVYGDDAPKTTGPATTAGGEKMATDSQRKWITAARDKGQITMTDDDIVSLTFQQAVDAIGKIRKALGK